MLPKLKEILQNPFYLFFFFFLIQVSFTFIWFILSHSHSWDLLCVVSRLAIIAGKSMAVSHTNRLRNLTSRTCRKWSLKSMYVNVHAQTIFDRFQLKLETVTIHCRKLDLSFPNCLPWEDQCSFWGTFRLRI